MNLAGKVAAISLAFAICARGQTKLASTDALFAKVLPEIQHRSSIPPRLPRMLQLHSESAHIEEASRDFYEVVVGFGEECGGQHWCTTHILTGEKTSKVPKGESVRLKRSTVGYYRPYACAAYCSNASISWIEGDYLYTIEIKAGGKEDLVAAANSALSD